MKSIAFIGGGRITNIFFQAFKNANIQFNWSLVYDVDENVINALKLKFPQIISASNIRDVAKSELIILAVHPPKVKESLEQIKDDLNPDSVLISLAPKFTIDKITTLLDGFENVVRMNPSASTIVNKGVNPMAFASSFDINKKAAVLSLFQPLGYTPEIEDSKIEAYAVISAMGHTYFNFQLQQLKELAISFGMAESEANKAISNMLWGTTETLFKSGLSYNEVADLVPVKPMGEVEEAIKGYYNQYLPSIFEKIKP